MPLGDALKKFRQSEKEPGPPQKDEPEAEHTRMFKLTDDEAKSLGPYNVHPGEEIKLEVSGKLEDDGHFHVMSVKYSTGPGMDAGADAVMGKAPTVQMQTMPSPS